MSSERTKTIPRKFTKNELTKKRLHKLGKKRQCKQNDLGPKNELTNLRTVVGRGEWIPSRRTFFVSSRETKIRKVKNDDGR
jgi:hypothetical protein